MILTFNDSIKTLIVCVVIAFIDQWFITRVLLKHGLYRLLIGYHSFLINMLTYACFIVYSIIRLVKLNDDYNAQTAKNRAIDHTITDTTPTTDINS